MDGLRASRYIAQEGILKGEEYVKPFTGELHQLGSFIGEA
jgi:hypothetical protein